ncbi:MAG: insulinase family protein [Bacteroidales bacterium]|nr:insulinase family protein [Bacteroidales bacterium]MDD4669426.1 insulinase family protein [Bacteroidales bacterium]
MKKLSLVLSLFLLFATSSVFCQNASYPEIIPLDPQVRVGTLENGLTYYIRHNENPKNRADFFIANNVGAMQEEDNQNGLAHFLEHLAFNGLKHFPDKEMLNYLSKNGVKFGANVNAYTSRLRTVYNMSNIPLTRDSFVDSVILILHDWSYYILCEPDQIEAERGVIREEWRRGDDPRSRMQDKQDSLAYLGSKYSHRTVIGDFNIINNFERQTLIDFYHKWYRPDMQAVIIVGDFDVNKMEAKVKRILSDLPKVENGAKKEFYDIPYQKEPIVAVTTDSEIAYVTTKVLLKQPYPSQEELKKSSSYKQQFARSIFTNILSNRFELIKDCDEYPLKSAVAVNGALSQCRNTTLITTTPKDENKLIDNLKAIFTEFKRVEQYGFTEEEFEISKAQYYKKYRMHIDVKEDDITNNMFVESYINHFTAGVPYMDPFEQQKIYREIYDSITLEDVNDLVPYMITNAEKIVIYSMNDDKKSIAPSVEQSLAAIEEVQKSNVGPFSLKTKDASGLKIDNLAGSKITKTKQLGYFGSEEWTLSNGIKIVWTPTADSQKNMDMMLTGRNKAGYSLHNDIQEVMLVDEYLGRMGVRDYRQTDIKKVFNKNDFRNAISIKRRYGSVSGNSSAKEFEQMLSMLYLYVTEPNFGEKEFNTFVGRIRSSLENKTSEREKYLDTCSRALYGYHPWETSVDIATCDRITVDAARAIFDKQFGNMKDYIFFISGTMPKEEVQQMVEKYIGSLPTSKGKAKEHKTVCRYDQKNIDFIREGKERDIPKSFVFCIYHGDMKYTAENNMILSYLKSILSRRYLASIREEKGGTYHVGVSEEIISYYGGYYDITVDFETNPKMVDILLAEVQKGVEDLAATGPTQQEMGETLKYMIKANAETQNTRIKAVSYWQKKVMDLYLRGEDLREDDLELIKSVNAAQVQKAAQMLLKNYKFTGVFSEKYKQNK